jgi:hypothetical protein
MRFLSYQHCSLRYTFIFTTNIIKYNQQWNNKFLYCDLGIDNLHNDCTKYNKIQERLSKKNYIYYVLYHANLFRRSIVISLRNAPYVTICKELNKKRFQLYFSHL